MSRKQSILVVVLALAVVTVFCCLGGLTANYLVETCPTLTSLLVQPFELPTPPSIATAAEDAWPTPSVAKLPTSPPPTPKPEPPTPTNTRVIPLTTPPHRATATPEVPFAPDEWEPDNSLAEASPIGVGERQTHNLHVEGDHDWMHFEVQEGTVYVIETSNLGDEMDTVIHLYDEEGNELASDDDGGEDFLASRLWWAPTEAGRLYVMISSFSDMNKGPGTNYDVTLRLGEDFEVDEYEPDDSRAQARRIGVGETQTHNRHRGGDQDWVYFEAQAGTTYIIETSNLGDGADTVVYLYDQDGEELASDDDGGAEMWASLLEWTAPHDGTLYVMVEDWLGTSTGPETSYDISLLVR